MVSITIDGFKVKVNKNLTILQACDDFGVSGSLTCPTECISNDKFLIKYLPG